MSISKAAEQLCQTHQTSGTATIDRHRPRDNFYTDTCHVHATRRLDTDSGLPLCSSRQCHCCASFIRWQPSRAWCSGPCISRSRRITSSAHGGAHSAWVRPGWRVRRAAKRAVTGRCKGAGAPCGPRAYTHTAHGPGKDKAWWISIQISRTTHADQLLLVGTYICAQLHQYLAAAACIGFTGKCAISRYISGQRAPPQSGRGSGRRRWWRR